MRTGVAAVLFFVTLLAEYLVPLKLKLPPFTLQQLLNPVEKQQQIPF